MQQKYDPCAANPYFPRHKYLGIPIDRNIAPVNECKLHHYVGPAATLARGIAVHILTPEHLWASFQAEAEQIVTVDGRLTGNDAERNKRINAAYARLWLADRRFQWAGLAAFASKQVGCGLLHAGNLVAKNRRERERIGRAFAQAAAPGVEYAAMLQAGTEVGAHKMNERLAHGNKHLFLDIYPLHRFYMERGWKEFDRHLDKRQNNKYPVHWEIDRAVLRFGTPFQAMREGFEQIDAGHIASSVQLLARHEQVNILQAIIYNDRTMQSLLALNQFAWATGFPTGDYEEVQLTLSAECKAKAGLTSWFSRDRGAKLWDVAQRVQFVLGAAKQFDKLLSGPQLPQVEASLRAIAAGGGVA